MGGTWTLRAVDTASDSTGTLSSSTLTLDGTAAIPIYYYLSENIVSPKIKGFQDNAFDIHRTRWLEKTE